MNLDNVKVLISEEEIEKRNLELAEEIYKQYGDEEVTFLITLKGATPFAMDLAKKYKGDCVFDFIRVSSYAGTESTGNIILKVPVKEENIKDKNILVIEDIIDTGNTMKYLIAYLKDLGAKSVRTCTLLNKQARRKVDVKADYVGFEIDDYFVMGYGLDYDEKLRQLPYVGYIETNK